MTIKFNPFKAQTILFAFLLALEAKSEKKAFKFEHSTEDLPDKPLERFLEKKKEAKEKNLVLPANSPYTKNSLPYFFYLTNEAAKWRSEDSKKAAAGLVLKVMERGMKAVFDSVAFEVENPLSKSFFEELKRLGGAAHQMIEVMDDKALVELFMKKKAEMDAAKEKLAQEAKSRSAAEAKAKLIEQTQKKAEAKAKYEEENGKLEAEKIKEEAAKKEKAAESKKSNTKKEK